jgi:HEAT repeat protein
VPGSWGITPRESVRGESECHGEEAVVAGCLDVLTGRNVDERLLRVLGGPAAEQVLDGREGGTAGYWPRVWATRGLLYAWNETATATVVLAASDEAWRVREMAAKVIARHRIDNGLDAVIRLRGDPVPRVRAAAQRAIAVLTAAGA